MDIYTCIQNYESYDHLLMDAVIDEMRGMRTNRMYDEASSDPGDPDITPGADYVEVGADGQL